MPKFRKKPVVIEAQQVHPTPEHPCNCQDLIAWIGMNAYLVGAGIEIENSEGVVRAVPGDWIVRHADGHIETIPREVFEATYEAVTE